MYKILHLPTGTYLSIEILGPHEEDYINEYTLYTEYEIEHNKDEYTQNLGNNKKNVIKMIRENMRNATFQFEPNSNGYYELLKFEHCEIIKVENV